MAVYVIYRCVTARSKGDSQNLWQCTLYIGVSQLELRATLRNYGSVCDA